MRPSGTLNLQHTFMALRTKVETECQPITSSNEKPCERTSNWVTLLDLLAFLDANFDNNARHRRSKGAGGVGGPLPRNGLDSGVFVFHGDSTDLENEGTRLVVI